MAPEDIKLLEERALARVCKQCGKGLAYPGAVYCGAACCAAYEMGVPLTGPGSADDDTIGAW